MAYSVQLIFYGRLDILFFPMGGADKRLLYSEFFREVLARRCNSSLHEELIILSNVSVDSCPANLMLLRITKQTINI